MHFCIGCMQDTASGQQEQPLSGSNTSEMKQDGLACLGPVGSCWVRGPQDAELQWEVPITL